ILVILSPFILLSMVFFLLAFGNITRHEHIGDSNYILYDNDMPNNAAVLRYENGDYSEQVIDDCVEDAYWTDNYILIKSRYSFDDYRYYYIATDSSDICCKPIAPATYHNYLDYLKSTGCKPKYIDGTKIYYKGKLF
ncbi:MAG: hypothetical protein K2J74_08490, partial [Muribaculaceae bacterium]|nr:hypothetical protein [Muribaculaceae bacterium]